MRMNNWWKYLSIVLIIYSVVAGLTGDVPRLAILHETIRNLYFHVTMWFTMIALFIYALIHSFRYLSSGDLLHDTKAGEAVQVALLFGILGILTGSVWAKFTWGDWWTNDVKLNGAAISVLAYLAYTILRGSLDDRAKRARFAAVYNIFAFAMMLTFIFVLPRMTDSLHPGNGGNPAFNTYDLNDNMRWIFYPAVMGWILFGFWLTQLRVRMMKLEDKS